MTTDIGAAANDLAEMLRAGGVRASVDPRNVNPPCCLIGAPVLTYRMGKGCADATWSVLAIVPDNGAPLPALTALVNAAQDALHGAAVTATPASVATGDGAAPLPAYALTFTTRIYDS